MSRYDHKAVEQKWQKRWEESGTFTAREEAGKQKTYLLVEFPYPSGAGLHTGHVRSYTAMDAVARKRRRQGESVLYPIGWDAFGLPTENYAIKTGRHPRDITKENTDTFRRQLKSLGLSFDWSREVNTTDPAYYRWTQWIFLQLLKHGLAYKAKAAINWCPKDKIGLANEEVVDGVCERCGTPVEKREKEQWMLAITKYAEALYNDLDALNYIERAKVGQKNWIGPSEGARLSFPLVGIPGQEDGKHSVEIFTTRPDTIFGATFIAVSAGLAKRWIDAGWQAPGEVASYIQETLAEQKKAGRQEVKEKTGIYSGVDAVNPANQERIPVWLTNYVLEDVGTGAIMAVPAHDERDFAFAQAFGLPVRAVIEPVLVQTSGSAAFHEHEPAEDSAGVIAVVKHWGEEKYLGLSWPEVGWGTLLTGGIDEGHTPEETVLKEIREETGYTSATIVRKLGVIHSKYYHAAKQKNRFGHAPTFYVELADDRREPVSEEEANKHDLVWLTKEELKAFLTSVSHLEAVKLLENPAYTGPGLLADSGSFTGEDSELVKQKITEALGGTWMTTWKLRDWVFSRQRYWGEPIPVIHCPKCGAVPVPEAELPVELPEVERYEPTDTGESPLANIADWVNVSCPSCDGAAKRETDVMPNWAGSSWYYLRYTDPNNATALAAPEKLSYWTPVDWYNGGMEHTVLHLLYSRFWHKFLHTIGIAPSPEPYTKRTSHGLILAGDGEKMSKSRGNVVNPDEIVERDGADTLRVYEMFMGPFDQAIAWSDEGLTGARRFLDRVAALAERLADHTDPSLVEAEQACIKKVTEDIEALKMNTAIAELMSFSNKLHALKQVPRSTFRTLLSLLEPFAPHLAEELWERGAGERELASTPWPAYDPALALPKESTVAIQVNGKLRGSLVVPSDLSKDELVRQAKALPEVAKWLGGKEPARTVVVEGRLVNFVVMS